MRSAQRTAPRKAELLDVAKTLFYERGYAHTTLQDIADRMGFTKAAVYYYARNKEELLVEIYAAIVEPTLADARRVAAEPGVDGATRFVAMVERHLQTLLRNIEANAVLDVQGSSLSAPAKDRMQRLGRAYDAVLRGVYEEGIRDGSIAPGDAAVAVNAVIGMCNSVHRWYRPRGRTGVEQLIAQLLELVSTGIRSAAPPGEGIVGRTRRR